MNDQVKKNLPGTSNNFGHAAMMSTPKKVRSNLRTTRFQPAEYITDIPYVRIFTRELAPAWLDHVALVSGFAPPSRDQGFAWCDLGCGQGVTPAILAATHPAGRFCGIDFIPAHIENARRFAAECAIENVEFHPMDFSAAAETDFGGFDYIVCHGVFSWVNEQSQNALRRFIDRHLKPRGLVYISYYAMPGRAADLPFQRLVRALGLTLSGDSAERCAAAVEIVHKLTKLKAPALVGSPMAVRLKEHPADIQLAYLSHELMSANWEPICVTDLRAAMRKIGLMPVGSATLIENYDSFVLGQAARKTLAAIADLDARALARDFLIDQFFRRDVFVRDSRALDENERRSQLLTACFALTRPASAIEFTTETPAGHLRYDNGIARDIVAALTGGPCSLAHISTVLALAPQDVLANALVLSATGALRPVERCRTPIPNLNEAIYRRLGGPEEIRFLALPCGTALPIDDTLLRLIKGNMKESEFGEWRDFLAAHGL
jgi:SAM-dependent methyltransferase